MVIENRVWLNLLYDFYGSLLTQRQNELFELRFQLDLSLGEIAENLQITRQAVHDLLGRTARQLHFFEENLQLAAKHMQRQRLLDLLAANLAAGDLKAADCQLAQLKNL